MLSCAILSELYGSLILLQLRAHPACDAHPVCLTGWCHRLRGDLRLERLGDETSRSQGFPALRIHVATDRLYVRLDRAESISLANKQRFICWSNARNSQCRSFTARQYWYAGDSNGGGDSRRAPYMASSHPPVRDRTHAVRECWADRAHAVIRRARTV